jgi:uncharacterized membrane protein
MQPEEAQRLLHEAVAAANAPTWVDYIHEGMHVCAVLIGVVGVAIVVWGVACGAVRLVALERTVIAGGEWEAQRSTLRKHLGFYLLLGLEFLVAADIIETLIAPSLEHVLLLGAIVIIRTIISVSLNWELSKE